MLFLLSGAAASGKKTVARHVTTRVANLVAHHENEIPATTGHGRMANMEQWIERALALEPDGVDLLLLAASPLGEVLASPRAPELSAIAACLLDCHDHVRAQRIAGRSGDPDWPFGMDTLCWAAWHRMHAVDPQFEQHVIIDAARSQYAWNRWKNWTRGDPRWRVELIDTTSQAVSDTVDAVAAWIERARSHGTPLSRTGGWWN
jgi:hypothetical protein